MNQLIVKKLKAINFLCFGPKGIEIDLTSYGNVILIRGRNLDVIDEEGRASSNGSGKSSIIEIFVYAVKGKTVKSKLKHKDVINNITKKKLYTEVEFNDCRVVRTRKPEALRLWESKEGIWNDESELTLGSAVATQELRDEKLGGLSLETLINVVVFADNNSGSFLESDGPTKRKIVENLLSLDKYQKYSETAKARAKIYKDKIKTISASYEHMLAEFDKCKNRIDQVNQQKTNWAIKTNTELTSLMEDIKKKAQELKNTDMGVELTKYNEAQDKIKELNSSVPEIQDKIIKVKTLIGDIRNKFNISSENKRTTSEEISSLKKVINSLNQDVTSQEKAIKSFTDQKDTKCPRCLGTVKEKNYRGFVEKSNEKIDLDKIELNKTDKELKEKEVKFVKYSDEVKQLNNLMTSADEKEMEFNVRLTATRNEIGRFACIQRPETGATEKIIEKQIEDLKLQAIKKKQELDGPSPFKEILKSTDREYREKQEETDNKKSELKELEKELPYYTFWIKAFGDRGIRKFIIDGIIPALNSNIAHWLEFLIDSKIKLSFDNELEAIITRNPVDGDPFVYNAMSGGERRRLNLAVSQAFAHVMMLNTGTSPSIVFLDEVSTNIDPVGVDGVYNMIMELAKEKQVFVTTHDHDLLEMLGECESINLVKKDGFAKLV